MILDLSAEQQQAEHWQRAARHVMTASEIGSKRALNLAATWLFWAAAKDRMAG